MPSTPEGVRGGVAKEAATFPTALVVEHWLRLADKYIAVSAARSAHEPSRPDVLVDRAAVSAMTSEGGRVDGSSRLPAVHPTAGAGERRLPVLSASPARRPLKGTKVANFYKSIGAQDA